MAKLKKLKEKKQFRLYDIYRYAATGIMSNIRGIDSYECNDDASTVVVRFVDITGEFNELSVNYFAKSEYDLKQIVKEVNKRLGNCMKPGRMRRILNVAQ